MGLPGAPLRRRLLLLAAAGIVPLAVMAGVGLYALAQQQRAQADRVGLELARALATAVDAELRGAVAILETLATATALDNADLPGFQERALRIAGAHPEWAAVMLADPSGQRLMDTRFSRGAALPPVVETVSFASVLRTRAPVVGKLAPALDGGLLFPVRVPVLRLGELRYVLTAVVKPDAIRQVVIRQQIPGDWVISIFDANDLRVARSRAHAENLGGRASSSLQALMGGDNREGVGITRSLEGERIHTAFSRLEPSGWSAAVGMPASLVEGGIYRSLAVYGGGILLSLGLGAAAAQGVARSINRPIAHLRAAAQALGRRETPHPPLTSIREIRDVSEALMLAASERTRRDTEREELLRRERAARSEAESANRAKDEFLAILSHELRTPLNAVYGWSHMLLAGQVRDDQTSRALEAIVRNANAQVQLIDDLLDVSRVITGKLRLDVRPVDLRAVVEAALDAVRPAAMVKEIRLESVFDPRAGPITGDPARLQQAMWNLLMNAVKFTPKGGRVQAHLQRVNAHVEIVVSDTGQGITAEVLPFVFDRFRQADSSSTRTHGGLGLGLALVKHLVELHGGSVDAQSPGEGRGASFIIRLPLTLADVPVSPLPRPQPTAPVFEARPAGVRLDGLRVLVVDDDRDALDLTEAVLARAGAVVRTCLSAPDALDVLRQWRPEVLVSDIEMPGEDGYTLIRKVRALDGDPGKTPAVALTAYGRPQDRALSLTAGYNMHVPKPVDPGELTAIIASVVRT